MEEVMMDIDGYGEQQIMPDALPFARSYQLEALDKAIRENTIAYLETGSGKTLIAIMLLRSYACYLRKPSPYIAVFLVPKVVLVSQQAKALRNHTDLKIGMYWGDMGVDHWDGEMWKVETEKHEVLVMTPAILLSCLRHSFIKLKMIKVLIMDECHNASGKHPYACIMTEFYHHQLRAGITELPRIFGMTASPINTAAKSESTMSKHIRKLMTLMDSKVYTCVSDTVISQFIPMSTPKFRYYKENVVPYALFDELAKTLNALKEQHELSVTNSDFTKLAVESAHKKISKTFEASIFCLEELGVWLALKAAESLSSIEIEISSWGNSGDQIVKKFISATVLTLLCCVPSDPQWTIGENMNSDMEMGLLTSKVSCLIDCLLEYKDFTEMRCIVFVERVITARVLEVLLNTLFPKYNSWRAKSIAGNNSKLQNQSRKCQNQIVEEFRDGLVNVIVATSILEEGLDVQSCNLVIRFDPSPTVCSFVQSRGRARMQNSDYILMVKSGDSVTHSRLEKYLSGEAMMKKESLHYSSLPCERLASDQFNEQTYRVASTGAVVNLSSSISLIYLYCSRLPSDGYFKPTPRWDKQKGTLYLPKSCALQAILVQGDTKFLKNIACLEACKQLHKIGALSDHLVPSIVVEEAEVQEFGNEPFDEEQPSYVPFELVNRMSNNSNTIYYCYLIELKQNFSYDITVQDIFLATRVELDPEIGCTKFDMCFDRGSLSVELKFKGSLDLSPDQVLLCKGFQVNILGILMNYKTPDKETILDKCCLEDDPEIDYLLLPSVAIEKTPAVDWLTVNSIHPSKVRCMHHESNIWTANGLVCGCILRNALICTPHNGRTYITTDIMELHGNSPLEVGDGEVTTYKKYFGEKHGIRLRFEHQRLLKARHVFPVKNYCHGSRQAKDRDVSKTFVELPPELCSIIMSPISVNTLYSFSFIPSIMHRVESLLGAFNFQKMHLDRYRQNRIQTFKILEAMTTKSCKETFHYESLETFGDSFLKYAVSQQLFNTHQNHHEGLLSVKREKIICNASLCKLGCGSGLPGFIRNEPFDPKTWIIPGAKPKSVKLEEFVCKGRKFYTRPNRKLRRKVVADVVEALIGAFLSAGGETAALLFMDWIGIKVNFNITPYERQFNACPENIVNVVFLESLLKYSFRDRSLLVEALTHGSYMLPDVPRCYQRLEYLGDSVLDYLITLHLYKEYPGMSPGQLTDMRAASVNNDYYARSAIKVQLHNYVLHASPELHKHIVATLAKYNELSSASTFGWESEASFPKVLGDIIESLAGAILVDSGYNKEVVWQSIRPLLEPLVTPDTLTVHPVRELTELCQKMNYTMEKTLSRNDGVTICRIKVTADGMIHKYEYKGSTDRKTATRLACKGILNSLQLKATQHK
ncbi:hypothetical protein P8452_16351 [Trifolium repens]|nr:hypothetical protein P8452_16351 [Trifolium repens]